MCQQQMECFKCRFRRRADADVLSVPDQRTLEAEECHLDGNLKTMWIQRHVIKCDVEEKPSGRLCNMSVTCTSDHCTLTQAVAYYSGDMNVTMVINGPCKECRCVNRAFIRKFPSCFSPCDNSSSCFSSPPAPSSSSSPRPPPPLSLSSCL